MLAITIAGCTPTTHLQNESDAKFIFRGTVEQINAATLPEITETQNCVVVKVNEVLETPPDFTDWTGRSITVLVKDAGKLKPGVERVFFTNGWLFGKSIAVMEVSSKDPRETDAKTVQNGIKARQENLLRERLKASELVIAGKVVELQPSKNQEPGSEHDPEWVTAIIEVSTTLKGQTGQTKVPVQFASSIDVMWYGSPKFTVGQQGIWLLQKPFTDKSGYQITDKADFYPIEQLDAIRNLLK